MTHGNQHGSAKFDPSTYPVCPFTKISLGDGYAFGRQDLNPLSRLLTGVECIDSRFGGWNEGPSDKIIEIVIHRTAFHSKTEVTGSSAWFWYFPPYSTG